MNAMTRYILSVTAAAVLVSILRTLSGIGKMGKLINLLCGLFLVVTMLAPVIHLEIPDPGSWLEDHLAEGAAAADAGEVMAREYSDAIISAEVEAYILDKAASLGADLMVEVSLGEAGLPESVVLSGNISPADRQTLSRIIHNDLGMGEEAQTWNG